MAKESMKARERKYYWLGMLMALASWRPRWPTWLGGSRQRE